MVLTLHYTEDIPVQLLLDNILSIRKPNQPFLQRSNVERYNLHHKGLANNYSLETLLIMWPHFLFDHTDQSDFFCVVFTFTFAFRGFCSCLYPKRFIHTFKHRRQSQPHRATASLSGAVMVRRLSQGHLDTQLVGAGDRTSNLLVTSQPEKPALQLIRHGYVHPLWHPEEVYR